MIGDDHQDGIFVVAMVQCFSKYGVGSFVNLFDRISSLFIFGGLTFARSRVKKFIVLGFDGMDPKLTRKFLAEGKLPNFAKLAEQGCFKELGS
ncbi:MAG TPA: hypothetical protein ENH94_07050, partial [Phycisphaerales bacterium]|nr:hypothetical protein [Phycisphaerales bacterium]